MHLTTIFSAVSITSGVLAVPLQTCLTPEQASCIVEKYIGIADGTGYDNQSANATAQALISDDFIGDSGSILSLQERPVKAKAISMTAQTQTDVWGSSITCMPHPRPSSSPTSSIMDHGLISTQTISSSAATKLSGTGLSLTSAPANTRSRDSISSRLTRNTRSAKHISNSTRLLGG